MSRRGKGTCLQALDNQSTATKIQAKVSDRGRLVIKSTVMCDHGQWGTGKGMFSLWKMSGMGVEYAGDMSSTLR